ncbi:GNAT family N-acetyltransferase [Leifsonia poae]|uniref:GNAT family N-acetyltransferase n=1 Tax=Leifsonia poae TaxID=110933 RepID=UPI003D68EB2E
MTGEIMVRRATVADAAGIARVHVTGWREAYAGRLAADFLDGLDEARFAANWERIVVDGVTDAFVAERDGEIVGWATAGPGRDDDPPRPRELEGIYLVASAYGSGAGQQLLDAAVGDSPAYLWVMEGNARAESFYRRNGFAPDGATSTHTLGATTVPVLRFTR